MLTKEKVLEKYHSTEALQELQARLARGKRTFGNTISRLRRDISILAENIISEGVECEWCGKVYSIADMNFDIAGYKILCDECINDNFSTCSDCGEYILIEDIKEIDGEGFCEVCYNEASKDGSLLYQAKTNGDKEVFKCKKTSKDIKGYELVQEFFVDNSGFGSESEPALTPAMFLREVKAGYYYGITNIGQFQVYIGEFKKL